jgi:peptidoglycan/LPS O-acetylase OafA/YrhL/SAM-dependent methyltransferase
VASVEFHAPPAVPTDSAAERRAGRVGNLDVLRAIAAFAVLALHAYSLGGRNVPIRAQYWYDVPLIGLASGVWLFFALSGYVISRPFVEALLGHRPLPALVPYALRRALRIYPLYWIALSVLIAIAGAGGVGGAALTAHYLLYNNLLRGQEEAVFPAAWTLTLEAIFYAAVPALALVLARRRRALSAERLAALVLASWLLSIAFTAVADLQGESSTGLWLRFLFPSMWQSFCPGIMLAIAPHLRSPRWRRWLVRAPAARLAAPAIVVLGLAAVLLSARAPLRFGVVPYELVSDLSRPLFALAYGLLVAGALRARDWSRHGRWILTLGLASYGIYLIHPVLEELLLRYGLDPLAHDTVPAYLVHVAFLGCLTIVLAISSWNWVERPAIGLARVLGARWQAGRGTGTRSTMPAVDAGSMRSFWNERAREDARYFVDTRRRYRAKDRGADEGDDAERIVDFVLGTLGVALRPGGTVLEIGCGIGRLTRVLAARAGKVIALDVSDEMLAHARARHPDLGHVRWLLGDGVSLHGVPDSTVDACLSTVVFQHVPDPEIVFGYVRELGRVLRPGGWAALQVSNDPRVHEPRDGPLRRALALIGRAPRGQRHPAWLGAPVELAALRAAAEGGGLELERIWGEGSQYCLVLLRNAAGSV